MTLDSDIDMRRRAEELVSTMGRLVGLPAIALDADNSVTLTFNDEQITLTYEPESVGISLFAFIDRLPGPLGLQGMIGQMDFNEELFDEQQGRVLYNEMTLMAAALFRIDVWAPKVDGLLPWIDECLVTIGTIRERLWELLGADRVASDEETRFIR